MFRPDISFYVHILQFFKFKNIMYVEEDMYVELSIILLD